MRRYLKIFTGRLVIIVPLVALQVTALILFLLHNKYYDTVIAVVNIISIIFVIYEINKKGDSSYKIAWIILLLGAPIVGVPLYLLSANKKMPKKLENGTIQVSSGMAGLLKEDEEVVKRSVYENQNEVNVLKYGVDTCGFPVYMNTKSTYFASGEAWYEDLIKELKNAKHFILMEFFIIDQGKVLDEVLEILEEKVKEGVEVNIIYDDFGSITMPWHFDRKLRKKGINAYRFNPIRPIFIIRMNNRSHRKIVVIDNKVAYTGGVNLADEYAGKIQRFGHWRDSAIKLEGEAVWPITVMFLGMFSYVSGAKEELDFGKYKLEGKVEGAEGYYQPFADTPTDSEDVSFNMHMNMIKQAKKYIYINTPYLIPNETLTNTLVLASKSGVDVRILTPHIPDKRTVFLMTRGNYAKLLEAGVKIYEYTPGFNHTKDIIVDDELAIIGSVNMDYRSYFLHFENGVMLYKTKSVLDARDSFLKALEVSEEITKEKNDKTNVVIRLIQAVLNIFIPLV